MLCTSAHRNTFLISVLQAGHSAPPAFFRSDIFGTGRQNRIPAVFYFRSIRQKAEHFRFPKHFILPEDMYSGTDSQDRGKDR